MLSLQSLCSLVLLRAIPPLTNEEESFACTLAADTLSLPLPTDIDARNENNLRNLRACEEMQREMKTAQVLLHCAYSGRFDLLDRHLDAVKSHHKKIKIAIDLHNEDEEELARYVERRVCVNYNFIYTNPSLLCRITRRETFDKILEAGFDIQRNFEALLCSDPVFCWSRYYPYNEWIIETLPSHILQTLDIMLPYDGYRVAAVRDGVIEVFSELND